MKNKFILVLAIVASAFLVSPVSAGKRGSVGHGGGKSFSGGHHNSIQRNFSRNFGHQNFSRNFGHQNHNNVFRGYPGTKKHNFGSLGSLRGSNRMFKGHLD